MLSGPLKERLTQLKTLKEEEEKRNAALPAASPDTATEAPSSTAAPGKNDWKRYGDVTDCSRIELSCPYETIRIIRLYFKQQFCSLSSTSWFLIHFGFKC